MNDLKTSQYCDFEINNDILISKELRTLKRIIDERLKTESGDFQLNPNIGSDLKTFIGRGLNSSVIEDIKINLVYALSFDGLVNSSDIDIQHVVVGKSTLYLRISIKTPYGVLESDKVTTHEVE